jgi:hypothetical protein
MYENVTTEHYLNINSEDKTEADEKEINKFVQTGHKRKKEVGGKEEEAGASKNSLGTNLAHTTML